MPTPTAAIKKSSRYAIFVSTSGDNEAGHGPFTHVFHLPLPAPKRFPLAAMLVLATIAFTAITTELLPSGLLPQISDGLTVSAPVARLPRRRLRLRRRRGGDGDPGRPAGRRPGASPALDHHGAVHIPCGPGRQGGQGPSRRVQRQQPGHGINALSAPHSARSSAGARPSSSWPASACS